MTLYNADCLKVFQEMEAGSVDMVLVDLPYGTTQNKWDSLIPFPDLWCGLLRVTKTHAAMVFTAQTPFDKILGCSNLPLLRYEWIWRKNVSTGFMNAKKMPLKIHENVLVFYRELPTYNPQFTEGKPYMMKRGGIADTGGNYGKVGIQVRTPTLNEGTRYPTSVLDFSREVGLHPTQKPVALFEYLVRTYTNPGDLVLDCCMGSGTTGVACARSGRKFIGIELNAEYFAGADARIKASTPPITLCADSPNSEPSPPSL
jgi:site-specific DNA-methyltransferase (adenine-specific)